MALSTVGRGREPYIPGPTEATSVIARRLPAEGLTQTGENNVLGHRSGHFKFVHCFYHLKKNI